MKYIKYHKEFVKFLDEEGVHVTHNNLFKADQKLEYSKKWNQLSANKITLQFFFEHTIPRNWIVSAFSWCDGNQTYSKWDTLHIKWNQILETLIKEENEKAT